MPLVLLVDDNPHDRRINRDALAAEGFEVVEAEDGAAALKALYGLHPDVVLLDVVMPGMDGWTACQRVREVSDVPIIMLTSLNREEDIIRGLDLGADEFVSKPVSPRHLVARVRAMLRRSTSPAGTTSSGGYDDGVLSVDVTLHQVRLHGRRVDLTPTEFRLLSVFAGAPERVHAYAALLTEVWGPEYRDEIDFLRVYVWRLRKKIEADADRPQRILTERGFGYRFTTPR